MFLTKVLVRDLFKSASKNSLKIGKDLAISNSVNLSPKKVIKIYKISYYLSLIIVFFEPKSVERTKNNRMEKEKRTKKVRKWEVD